MVDGNQVESGGGSFSLTEFASEHTALLLALGAVALIILGSRALKSVKGDTGATQTSDLSGLGTDAQGNHIVYVPTSTEFYTDNSVNATSASGAPATIGNVNSPVNTSASSTTSTSTTTTTTNPPPVVVAGPPPTQSPPPMTPVTPNPPKHKGGLSWDQRYTVVGGDNLSRIASTITGKIRGQGAPSSVSVGWHDIYSHNQATIDNMARSHGITANPYNYIYPGESLTVPRWNKDLN